MSNETIEKDAFKYQVFSDLLNGKISIPNVAERLSIDEAVIWDAIFELQKQIQDSPLANFSIEHDADKVEAWIDADREKRRFYILEELGRKGSVRTQDIKEHFPVSEPTLRSDYEAINRIFAEKIPGGIVRRIRGGAELSLPDLVLWGYYARKRMSNPEAKYTLGTYIAQKYMENGSAWACDGGSTIDAVMRAAKQNNRDELRILTHSISIALEASRIPRSDIFLVGGELITREFLLIGGAEQYEERRFSGVKGVMTTTGFNCNKGATINNKEICKMKQELINSSDEVFLVFDLSKFIQEATYTVTKCGLAEEVLDPDGKSWLKKPKKLTIVTSVKVDEDSDMTTDELERAKAELNKLKESKEVTVIVDPEDKNLRDADFPDVCVLEAWLKPKEEK